MGTGWRRAFCTSVPQDSDVKRNGSPNASLKSCTSFSFFSSNSNPTTPKLHTESVYASGNQWCPSLSASSDDCPKLRSKSSKNIPRFLSKSNPSSPRSSSRFSLFRANTRLLRSGCGICSQSVKAGRGMAIFTAECSHAFHFPCIAVHVRRKHELTCPVCSSTWKEIPLLAIHKQSEEEEEVQRQSRKHMIPIREGPSTKHLNKSKLGSDFRTYNDDEPLSCSGSKFNTIPEADENEDSTEEFHGFFVNRPLLSSKAQPYLDENIIDVKLLADTAVVSSGRGHESYVLALKLLSSRCDNTDGPLLSPNLRAPIDLMTVLELSQEMSGEKLRLLKLAMRLLISSLSPSDRLGIVVFSATPKRILPLRRMTNQGQRFARRLVDRLVCNQGSNVSGACKKAVKVLEDRRERNAVTGILLLSDGTRSTRHQTFSSSLSFIEIPIYSNGIGTGDSIIESPGKAIVTSVCGLLNVIVQDLQIQIEFTGRDYAASEISGFYSCGQQPKILGSGSDLIRLGDLNLKEHKQILVEIKVPITSGGCQLPEKMIVKCRYKNPASGNFIVCEEKIFVVPRQCAARSSLPGVERLRSLYFSTRSLAEARRLVDHNDVSGALHLLSSTRSVLSSAPADEEYVRHIDSHLADLQRRRHLLKIQKKQKQPFKPVPADESGGEPFTPTSAWRTAEQLAKVAIMRKSLNRVSDLHGFENARF